jgi:hypothetical protein
MSRNLTIGIVLVLAVLLGAGLGVGYSMGIFSDTGLMKPHASSNNPPPWLFAGAYAAYSGETASDQAATNVTLKISVLSWNSTFVQTLSELSFSDSIHTAENKSTSWTSLAGAFTGQPPGYNFERSFNSTQLHSGAACDCVSYEYASGNATLTLFIGKASPVPMDVVYTDNGKTPTQIVLDMPLVDSNIPGTT